MAGCGQAKAQAHPKKARFVATFAVLERVLVIQDPLSPHVTNFLYTFIGRFGQGAKKEGLIEGERGAPVTVKTAKCKEAEIAPKPKKPKEPKEKAVFMEHGESH